MSIRKEMCSDESSVCLHPFSSDNEQITRSETKALQTETAHFFIFNISVIREENISPPKYFYTQWNT